MVGHKLAQATTTVLLLTLVRLCATAPEAPSAPHARVFASESGHVFLKAVPGKDGQPAMGTVTALAADGTEEVLWRKPLVRFPSRVFISDPALGIGVYLVAAEKGSILDHSSGRASRVKGVVVYDPVGVVVRDFGAVVPLTEPMQATVEWQGPRTILAEKFRFEGGESPTFVREMDRHSVITQIPAILHFSGRQTLRIDLKTGKETVEDSELSGRLPFGAAPTTDAPQGSFDLRFDLTRGGPGEKKVLGYDATLPGYHLLGDIAYLKIRPRTEPLPEKLVLAIATSPAGEAHLESFALSSPQITVRPEIAVSRKEGGGSTIVSNGETVSDAKTQTATPETPKVPAGTYFRFAFVGKEIHVTFLPPAMQLLKQECEISWVDWYRR